MLEKNRPQIFDSFDRILKARSPEAWLSRRKEIDLHSTIFEYTLKLTAEKRRNPSDDIWRTLASAVITGNDEKLFRLPANELEFFFVLTFTGSNTAKHTTGYWTAGVHHESRPDKTIPRSGSIAPQRR